ncbi:MAG: hypothetical protein OXF02_05225 [Simkaniaceae bacterium]|nr:hypothetical protein [Simkaniaceae bacterium]
MSCFSCFTCCKSSAVAQSGPVGNQVGNQEVECVCLGADATERIVDVVRGILGPDKQVVAVVVPTIGDATVLFRQSEGLPQVSESGLSARMAAPSPPHEEEPDALVRGMVEVMREGMDRLFVELEQVRDECVATENIVAEGVTEVVTSDMDRPPVPVPTAPPGGTGEAVETEAVTVENKQCCISVPCVVPIDRPEGRSCSVVPEHEDIPDDVIGQASGGVEFREGDPVDEEIIVATDRTMEAAKVAFARNLALVPAAIVATLDREGVFENTTGNAGNA